MTKKWIIAGSALLILGYIVLALIPNIFVRKMIDPEKLKNMQIVAHRGGAGIGLENTLSCIEKGIASGANMIEIDIHLTKDGHLLVCHDQTVDRTTNGKGKIREMTLDEIRKLNVVDAEGNLTDEHLPTLAEVLELINARAVLLIEIKRTKKIYQGIEQKMVDEIEKFQAASWVVVQSFNDSVLENINAINPELRLEKLLFCKFFGIPVIYDGTLSGFTFTKYSYVSSFNIFYQAASPSFIKTIHRQGKEVKIWTLNEPEKAPDLPVDGIITDRPDLWKSNYYSCSDL
jgi:glycerophosphoryl diester phosphodiesterase